MARFITSGKRLARMLAVAMAMLTASPLDACLQSYGTDVHGHATLPPEMPPDVYMDRVTGSIRNRAFWEAERDREKAKTMSEPGYKSQNDYAVALIHLAEYDDALAILEKIEKERPGLYATAANLGTLHELRGDNAKALQWIQEGLRRNKDSHHGTEWLHVRILETKIKLAKDPNWLKTNSVLGLDFGNDVTPVTPVQNLPVVGLDHRELAKAIEYQLSERLQFVEPPDPVVGDLLVDLGNINALIRSLEHAIPVYEFALKFGTPHEDLVHRRIEHFQSLAAANPSSGESAHAWIERAIKYAIAGVVAVMLLAVYAGCRWWSRPRVDAAND
jgi:tetratricopeptide (TPR) repeat protein